MLTCKSLFGLGYRGERLIEPLQDNLRWLRGRMQSFGLVLTAQRGGGNTLKLPGRHRYAPGTAARRKRRASTPAKVGGMVTIRVARDNGQPSATGASTHPCMQFTD